MPFLLSFSLAMLAGTGFALMGMTYRVAQLRSFSPQRLLLICSACGGALFGTRILLHPDVRHVPWLLVVMAVAAGLSQAVAIRLVAAAMKAGPFAPVWCALSLYFIPVIVYAGIVWDESVWLLQYLSIAAAIGAVLCGAGTSGQGSDHASVGNAANAPAKSRNRPLLYGVLLLAVLLVNGLPPIALKDLDMRPGAGAITYLQRYRDLYFTLFYSALLVGLLIESFLTGDLLKGWKATIPLGCVTGAGSILGVFTLSQCTSASAAMVFVVSGAVALLAAAIVSVIFLRERLSVRWAATVSLALAATLCNAFPPSKAAHTDKGMNSQVLRMPEGQIQLDAGVIPR